MPTHVDPPGFDVVMRGYSRDHVDRYLTRLLTVDSSTPPPAFPIGLRGYDRAQVDGYIAQLRGDPGRS